MDPDANLAAGLELANDVLNDQAPDEVQEEAAWSEHARACQLAELLVALDEWLGKGGALPQAWAAPEFSNGVSVAQAIALGSKVLANDTMHVTQGGMAGLGPTYLGVSYTNDPFVLGIDREGRCSS